MSVSATIPMRLKSQRHGMTKECLFFPPAETPPRLLYQLRSPNRAQSYVSDTEPGLGSQRVGRYRLAGSTIIT